MILHNLIRVTQYLLRRNSHVQTKLGDMPSLNNCVRLTSGHRDKGEQCSSSPEHQHSLGSEVPTKKVESCEDNQPSLRGEAQRLCRSLRPAQNLQVTNCHLQNQLSLSESDSQTSLRGEPLHNSLRVAQNRPFLRGAVHSITGSNPVQLSGSDLAFLRCRRLISPRIEVTINPALLSPSSLSDSISATTSCGTRTVKSCDFAFLLEVAITDSFDVWCVSVYAKKSYVQCLKCVSLECSFKSEGETHLTNSEARQCANTNRASYHNVTEAYIMACIQHTQTRPKYQYRFLALSAIGRNVIHITATTEREAREQSPAGCVMVFAGRLPVEVRHA